MTDHNRRLKRLIKKASEELWDAPPSKVDPTEVQSVKADVYDRMTYQNLDNFAPALLFDRMEMQEKYPTSPEAYEDLFNMLHQGDPQFRDQSQMDPEHLLNHAMLESLWEHPDFQKLRKDTKHDEYASAFTMLSMKDALADEYEKAKEFQEAQREFAQALQEAQQALQSGQGAQAAGDALSQALKDIQKVTDQNQSPGGGLIQAMQDAKDDLDEQSNNSAAYGLEPGQLQRMSYDERAALMQKLNKGRIEDLANLVGAFRSFADAERRRKVRHAPAEVYDYTLGNDLTKLASNERTNMAVPELEEQFWVRYFQHGLLQREVRGPESAGKGPIIVVCDESSSMSAQLGGNTREAWSKAVSLALCDQAKRGKRDFTYIGFASSIAYERTFRDGVVSIEEVIDFTSHFANGGTSFVEPLARALELVSEADKAGRAQPDIVFITDGDGYIDDDFIEKWHETLRRLDAHCYAIQVGGDSAFAAERLHQIANRVMQITKLNATPEGVKELFSQI